MGVSKTTLKEQIKAAFNAEKDRTDDQAGSIDRISEAIANAVALQIVQGVNTAAVVPTLASPAGAVTGTIVITTTVE